jgi:hypothetical protein
VSGTAFDSLEKSAGRERAGTSERADEEEPMPKQPHVPETRDADVKPNREQRRHSGKLEQPEDERLTRDPEPLADRDVPSTRAKSSGHGKKTADKWNQ